MPSIQVPAIEALIAPLDEAIARLAREAFMLNLPAIPRETGFFGTDPAPARGSSDIQAEGMALVRAVHDLRSLLYPQHARPLDDDGARRRWQIAVERAEVDEAQRRARARGEDLVGA